MKTFLLQGRHDTLVHLMSILIVLLSCTVSAWSGPLGTQSTNQPPEQEAVINCEEVEGWFPTIIEPDISEGITVSEAYNFNPPHILYFNNLTGECAINGSIPPDYISHDWDPCTGGTISVTYAEYLEWLHDVYFTTIHFQVIPDGGCNGEYCTLTQGAYGNPGGMFCDGRSQRHVMDILLHHHGGMVLGMPGQNRSFIIGPNDGQCIENILPGGGPSVALSGNYSCGNFGQLLKNGRLNNSLLAQTITAHLNWYLSPGLSSLVLESPDFFTVSSTGCGHGSPLHDTAYFTIPSSVYNYLSNKTVTEILALANEALGVSPWPSSYPSLSDITKALSIINEAFDGCRFIYFNDGLKTLPFAILPESTLINLTVAPNPFIESTVITFTVNEDTRAVAEIYDLQGRLITRLFEGNMASGEKQTITINGSHLNSQAPQVVVVRTPAGVKEKIIMMVL